MTHTALENRATIMVTVSHGKAGVESCTRQELQYSTCRYDTSSTVLGTGTGSGTIYCPLLSPSDPQLVLNVADSLFHDSDLDESFKERLVP
jgi:hypothetical protein